MRMISIDTGGATVVSCRTTSRWLAKRADAVMEQKSVLPPMHLRKKGVQGVNNPLH